MASSLRSSAGPRKVTYSLGAIFGALLIPVVVGMNIAPDASGVHDWYRAAAGAAVQAYLDLFWRGKALTQQYGHFLLILGLLAWGTGLYAGYVTFALKRPSNAVCSSGSSCVVNMSITIQDQLRVLVVFTLAALLFLIRVNTLTERAAGSGGGSAIRKPWPRCTCAAVSLSC